MGHRLLLLFHELMFCKSTKLFANVPPLPLLMFVAIGISVRCMLLMQV